MDRRNFSACRVTLLYLIAMLLFVALGIDTSPLRADPVKRGYAHDHVNIFPASAVAPSAKIDGDLSEWKPNAFVRMCADPDLLDVYSLRLAVAYDDAGLLLAADFTDSTPMMNAHDPGVEPAVGWAGDALQFRIISDANVTRPVSEKTSAGDQVAHLTMWWFTEKSIPALEVRYGIDYHGPVLLTGDKSNAAFKKTDHGYALETRIPWSLLHASAPKPGQKWMMTIQPLWGSGGKREESSFFDLESAAGFHFQGVDSWGDGYFVRADEVVAKLAEQGEQESARWKTPERNRDVAGILIKYNNPAAGFVSLAVCKPDGAIVRTLLAKAKRDAGEQTEMWDGLDDDAKPAPPGEYHLKALTHPGIKPRFVTSLMSSGNPPWGSSLPRNGWGADHGNPISASSDSQGNTYLLWHISEAASTVICVDASGQKQWGTSLPWGELGSANCVVACDEAEGRVYIAKDGPNHKLGIDDPDPVTAGLMAFDPKTGRRMNFPSGKSVIVVSQWKKALLDGAADPGNLSEKLKAGKFNVSEHSLGVNLNAMAVAPDRVYCSLYLENKIVALDKKTFEIAATYAVPKPAGIAYDAQRKLLYAISGNRSIVAIDVGKNGEIRPVVSDALEDPVGLALDKQGNLFSSVRGKQMQVLVFDPSGKPIRQIGKSGGRPFIGKYDPTGMLMPAGISIDSNNRLWVTEYDHSPKRISQWDASSGALIKEFFGSAAYSPIFFAAQDNPDEVYINNCRFFVDYETGKWKLDSTVWRVGYELGETPGDLICSVLSYQGKRFGFDGSTVYVDMGDHFKPAYLVCHGGPSLAPFLGVNAMPDSDNAVGYEWIDANGDGKTSIDECRKVPLNLASGTRCNFAEALFPGALQMRGTSASGAKKFLKPNGLTAGGIPNYPKIDQAESFFRKPGEMAKYDYVEDLWPVASTNDEQWYGLCGINTGSGTVGDSLLRFDRDGHMLWRYNRVKLAFGLGALLARPGDLFGALYIAGSAQFPKENAGEIVGVGVYRGYVGFLNEDGLFVDQIGYDNGRDTTPDFDTYFIENFYGHFFRHPKTGKCYLLAGDVDGRILELQGFENIRRFDAGTLKVTDDQFKQVVSGGSSAPGASAKEEIVHAAAGKEPKTFSKIEIDETRAAEVGLSYDAENLYAVYKVPDATPWQNAVKDWRFLFKTGDAVDLQIGIEDATSVKRKPQTGDVRVLIGPAEKPDAFTVVAMWPKYLPEGMEKQPQNYQSPTGGESFARVAQLAGVQCSIQRDAVGYTLKAAIPWKEIGLKPPTSGIYMMGDAGVLQSDGSGSQVILRRYLFNRDTAVVNDVPTEVRVDLGAWRKIYFE